MAPRQTSPAGNARHITIVGDNSQIEPTVAFLGGGAITTRVYTADAALKDRLDAMSGVHGTLVAPGYHQPPPDLHGGPYVIAVDDQETAQRIHRWIPRTRAQFLVSDDPGMRALSSGFLALMPTPAHGRRMLLRRLAILRRVDLLISLVQGTPPPMILMYGDPDPDAVGAALGLAAIWRSAGIEPRIRFTGEVQRYQNKILLGYLKEPIERLRDAELESSGPIALVDAQPCFWTTSPPKVAVVIDHHPQRSEIDAAYVDLRDHYGSTSTILTEYLVEANIPISRSLATALLYGVTTDTDDLQRHTSGADIRAYDVLHGRADRHFLARLAKSQVPMGMLDYISWGIGHRVVFRDLILIHFGQVPTTDVMVQAADLILLTCGINWVVCAGVYDDRLVVIFRGDGHRQDVGKRAVSAFGRLGSAGGHRTMGRAELQLHGEHVDTTVDLLVNNLFRRMSPARRREFIRILRNHLHGAGPASPEEMVFGA